MHGSINFSKPKFWLGHQSTGSSYVTLYFLSTCPHGYECPSPLLVLLLLLFYFTLCPSVTTERYRKRCCRGCSRTLFSWGWTFLYSNPKSLFENPPTPFFCVFFSFVHTKKATVSNFFVSKNVVGVLVFSTQEVSPLCILLRSFSCFFSPSDLNLKKSKKVITFPTPTLIRPELDGYLKSKQLRHANNSEGRSQLK